jgi:hypothetical protein
MPGPRELSKLYERYEKLKKEVGHLGLVAQGTITLRQINKPDPVDRRRKKTYGPYFQWTMKIKGRTVTVNLARTQAREFKKAIANQRKLENMLHQMRAVSLQILNRSTVGVPKRLKRSDLQSS